MGNLSCCGRGLFLRLLTATGRRGDGTNDRLPTGMDVDVLDCDALLALPAVTVEGVGQRRIGAGELIGLVQVLAPPLEGLLRKHRAPVALHGGVMARDQLCDQHSFKLVAWFHAYHGSNRRIYLRNCSRHYPEHLRRIRLRDAESGKTLVFLTNQFGLPATTVCALYKSRWQVELFFKWIKQHLRIKQFFGTSENAVKTQIWIAVSVYVLVAIVKKRLKLEASLYTLLQVLSVTLFEKLPLDQAFTLDAAKGVTSQITNQLDLFAY
jgi:DDE family transposase